MPKAEEILDALCASGIAVAIRSTATGYAWRLGSEDEHDGGAKPFAAVARDLAVEAARRHPATPFAAWWRTKVVYDAS